MRRITLTICCLVVSCLHLNACRVAQVLSTQYSENIASAAYGTEANHPGMNDGNLETLATLPARNERNFIIRFAEVHPVRKIIIHNSNLFRFEMDYLNPETGEWETFHTVIQRRNIGDERAQPEFVFDRLNFQTKMIRVAVTRTVDDVIVNKIVAEPGDKIVDRRTTLVGQYYPHYRVMQPAIAQIREIEVYHLAQNK
ncbi:hypothetical protein F4X88_20390 [Candidatus Poribacteria bacterium]|nr:hypothetical protein [Candidatus Poribacteria bacterium]MDE0686895.1 hypothetical protein [Candidatus Poribacteria bacterium]MXV83497.1 hypothetical protein [Candidatus Poribacteria bacterium]MYA58643.1 hypothetical protein [Candidatus Poribacteria bacterium]